MQVLLTGASGGIGGAVRKELEARGDIVWLPRGGHGSAAVLIAGDCSRSAITGVICCAGTDGMAHAIDVNLRWVIDLFEHYHEAKFFIALLGGGVGGAVALNFSPEYVASKAGLAAYVEQFAGRHPDAHVFAVSPGLTDTKMNKHPTNRGAKPEVPAAFICRLLTGKYHHLSGSMLAAQRDDLETMKPTRLRRMTV